MCRTGRNFYLLIVFGAIIFSTSIVLAQGQALGLLQYDESSFEGYTLFAPMSLTTTYLIDNYGRLVHTWESSYSPGASVYLLEDGNLLRSAKIPGVTGESSGGFQVFDWDGALVWEYIYASEDFAQHHDIEPLPNGNVLILAREFLTLEEAVAAGRDSLLIQDSTLWPEYIVEVQQTGLTTGDIAWEWHLWDHLIQDFDSEKGNFGVIADHPELMDLNYTINTKPDWIHANSIEYSPELDQVVISSHHTNEIWIIDHSTTTLESAGHTGGNRGRGGDIIYRWGNPVVYGAGTIDDRMLYGQHDAHWIKPGLSGEGNILIHNNGRGRPEGNFSTIEEIVTPVDLNGDYPILTSGNAYGPAAPEWTYIADPPESFYSPILSGMQRLPNGNTLICSGKPARFLEVDSNDEMVWEYISPFPSMVFRCLRFAAEYPGLVARDLTPGAQLENYLLTISGTGHSPAEPTSSDTVIVTTMVEASIAPQSVTLIVNSGSGDSFLPMDLVSSGAEEFFYRATILPMQKNSIVTYYLAFEIESDSTMYDPPIAPSVLYRFSVSPSESYVCGDANADALVNVGDAVFMINFIFKNGAFPVPYEAGDVNCDDFPNVGDAVYLINYIFKGGPLPCETCQ